MNRKPGDFIFWCSMKNIAPEETFAGAVATVGGGAESPFHVSLIATDVDHVIHALEAGVCVERISDVAQRYLLEHQKVKLIYVRLKDATDEQRRKALEFAHSKIGFPYNDTFDERRADREEAYYCCQLIRKAFFNAGCNVKFPLRPLNFRDANKVLTPFWVEYFRQRGMDVPESGIGSHPADLLNSDIVEVLHVTVVENSAKL